MPPLRAPMDINIPGGSVGNESLEVESESSLESMISSPSLSRNDSSQVNLHCRLESSRVSVHTDSSRVPSLE